MKKNARDQWRVCRCGTDVPINYAVRWSGEYFCSAECCDQAKQDNEKQRTEYLNETLDRNGFMIP